jgi:aminoglycoside phosphotransferase family enzyme/predicted kinase
VIGALLQPAPAVDLAGRIGELLRPEAFMHPATNLRLIETHISWVILAGEYAYKIRKPVNFGFLDFSSVANRHADCEAEIRLNRRLCPDLYRGMAYVVKRDGRLAIGGPGWQIEPAVWMRRLPETSMLASLLQRQAANERLMDRIAHQLADFHANAATGSGVDEHGSTPTIHSNWQENFAQTAACSELVLPRVHRETIHAYVDAFTDSCEPLLHQRVEQGRIRDGHGDLHAGSICVVHRRLYLFDCVEFSARFRCADVAAEVAFLAMDLDHLGRADLSHAFVDAYIRLSRDVELRALLDFYKCYRAFVRGKVLAFRLDEPALDASEAERIAQHARAYFDLAYRYASPAAQPVLLVTMGLPASGKTTLAHALAGRLGLVHLSSDMTRKHLIGMRPTAHRQEGFERGLYSRSMSRRTYAMLRRTAARWLRRRQSVVLDATFVQPAERAALRQLARRTGTRFMVIVCRADDQVLRARLAARATDSQTASDARLELWPALKAAFVEPTDLRDAIVVDTAQPLDRVLELVMSALVSVQVEGSSRAA